MKHLRDILSINEATYSGRPSGHADVETKRRVNIRVLQKRASIDRSRRLDSTTTDDNDDKWKPYMRRRGTASDQRNMMSRSRTGWQDNNNPFDSWATRNTNRQNQMQSGGLKKPRVFNRQYKARVGLEQGRIERKIRPEDIVYRHDFGHVIASGGNKRHARQAVGDHSNKIAPSRTTATIRKPGSRIRPFTIVKRRRTWP